ncbi:hypothetical protein ONZ45_g17569 [Pleurotus djamor]|nr:hypothetical protein ONZ45_g17569 [Pleurotus djamor]
MTVLNLSLIAATLDPVSTQPRSHGAWSSFAQAIVPTHTFASPPENLEVLFVPGGSGTRAPDLGPAIDYIRDVYPSLRYIVSICTGSWLLARAGVLEGRNATTNKASWASRPLMNGTVNWVPHARWVVDGNIWTSSGVSAGIDATLAFLEATFGADVAQRVTNGMEYTRHTNASYDPFAELHGL